MKIDAVIKQYLVYATGIEGLRESSAGAYRYKIVGLLKAFSEDGETFPLITEAALAEYMGEMRKNRSINTRRGTITALKRFYAWLCKNYPKLENPAVNLKPIREYQRMINVLKIDEVERMIVSCGRDNFCQIRNAAIICVLADTGIRVSELCALTMRDVSQDEQQFVMQVPVTKGQRGRSIPFAYQAEGRIVAEYFSFYYLLAKYKMGYQPGDPLFQRSAVRYRKTALGYVEGSATAYGAGPLHRDSISTMLSRVARRAGIESKVHPHAFRHFYATYLAAKGMDPIKIQGRLGHASLDMIQKYIHLAEIIKGDAAKDNPLSGVKSGWTGGVQALNTARQMDKLKGKS